MSDETRFWLEILIENLLDDDYCPAGDDDRHFKIGALQAVLKGEKDD